MKFVDLTLTISPDLPAFPGSPQPYFIPWAEIKKNGYNLEMLFFSSHSGTHLDAPIHFFNNGGKIHEISLYRLMTKVFFIKLKKESNEPITKLDIVRFEKEQGIIPNNSSIVFFTGWQKNLTKQNYFTDNPGLSLSAAKYLISKKVNLIGIDSPSIDLGQDKKFQKSTTFWQKIMY